MEDKSSASEFVSAKTAKKRAYWAKVRGNTKAKKAGLAERNANVEGVEDAGELNQEYMTHAAIKGSNQTTESDQNESLVGGG
jgi:hypothetical protein